MKLKYHILMSLAVLQMASLSNAAQQPLNTIPKSTASNAITVIREGVNTELAKQQTMNTELYSLTASGLPPCNNAGDIREWDGDSWECSPVIDLSATSPLSFNSTTGVLSLTPWASQSALETWLGWTFSGSGGGITVSSTFPTTAGSAALNDSTHVLTVASDTGYTQFAGSFTAWDTTPTAFGFGTIADATVSTEYCWTTPYTVAGINKPVPITATDATYKINGVASTATTVTLGDTVTPCVTTSASAGITTSGNITIGGVAGSPIFSITTSGASFDPATLFAGSLKGYWYDPSDMSTMYQDSLGTVAVTAVGQSVCYISDKSGNGLYASQSTSSKCPTLQSDAGKNYLAFDGGDVLVTASVNLAAYSTATSISGVKIETSSYFMVQELSSTVDANTRSFYGLRGSSGHCMVGAVATVGYSVDSIMTTSATSCASGATLVSTAYVDMAQTAAVDKLKMRLNNALATTEMVLDGATTASFGTQPFYIGGRGTTPTLGFTGRLYAQLVVTQLLDATETANIESYINGKTGAY